MTAVFLWVKIMIINYAEFDLDTHGAGLMSITCDDEHGRFYYICCGVYNSGGVKFDLSYCEVLGCSDDEGREVVNESLNARQILQQFFLELGVKTMLKNMYWHEFSHNQKDYYCLH